MAAVVMITLFAFLKKLPDYKQYWKQFVILGILNLLLPFTLVTYAVANLNASLGAILNATTPLFTMVVSAVWLKEKLTPKKLTGLVIGLAGLTVLVGWIPLALTQKVVISIVFSLLAALSYGIGAVYTRRALRHAEPLKTATGQITAAAILAAPLIGYSSTSGAIGLDISIAITVLAIVCTALGYTLYFKLITSVGSTNASLVTLLVPVFSLLWSILFLNEPLTPALLIGMAMILGSLKLVLAPSK